MNNNFYGKRLLPQVVDEAAKREPSRIIGMMLQPDKVENFQCLSIGQLARAVNFTAYWIEHQIGKSNNFEIIAYVGIGDFRYWIMELAAMKCGYPLMLPSGRNSDSSNMSLFEELKCTIAFYTPPLQSKTAALKSGGVRVFLLPTFDEMISTSGPVYPYTKTWEESQLDPVAICHTSGSTGLPKPVIYNNSFIGVMDAARSIPGLNRRPDGNISILDGAVYFLGFPAYHLMGVVYGLCSLFYRCIPVLPSPVLPPNGKVIIDIMEKVKLQQLICPPTLLDDLVKNFQGQFISLSNSLAYIHNAGGPLSKDTGNFLASKVSIIQIIGSTETAKLPCLVAEGEDWEWFEWNPHVGGICMERLDGSSDIYELTIKRIPGQEWAQAVFYAFPHLDLWRTRDLYRRHPTRDLWIFDGRKDDVIILNNGEKFNPIAMEVSISGHPLVKGVLAVGDSYDQLGLLLEAEHYDNDLVAKVWPAIQKANSDAPQYARVYKHMIIIASQEKPFSRAAKGTIQRLATTQTYKKEIEAMYGRGNTNQSTGSSRLPPQLKLSKSTIIDFVHQDVACQLGRQDFADSDDLYLLGFDSLQTTQLAKSIRDKIGPHLSSESSKIISSHLIYDNPSVNKISSALCALLNSRLLSAGLQSQVPSDVDQIAFEEIQELVRKYATTISPRSGIDLQPFEVSQKPHIAVTGTTGFLGYYLVSSLLDDPKIGYITCLNRSPQAREKFLEQCSIYRPKLPIDKSKLDFIQVSFGESSLGLPAYKFCQLVDAVDAVIHNAWQVDFNRSLSSFEHPHIASVSTFIDWSLHSPRNMHIFFVSSISAVANWPGFNPSSTANTGVFHGIKDGPTARPGDLATNRVHNVYVSELPPPASRIPSKLGYAQSKYTAERLLTEATITHNVRATIIRPGQISNARAVPGPLGSQNEWFPQLLWSSKHMRILPQTVTRTGMIDFIPVDQLADIVRDIVHASFTSPAKNNNSPSIFNLVNPNAVPFADLIPAVQQYFKGRGIDDIKIVPLSVWIEALRREGKANTDQIVQDTYPALKIERFFEGLASDMTDEEATIDTANGWNVSNTMRGLQSITGDDISTWLQDWKM